MQTYQLNLDQIKEKYQVDPQTGLTDFDAQSGDEKKFSFLRELKRIVSVCRNRISYIHIIAAVSIIIAFIFCLLNKNYSLMISSLIAAVILALLFLGENLYLDFLKGKFHSAIEGGKVKTAALRNGKKVLLSEDELRIGDVILLEEGSVLCADARILKSERLFCDEKLVFHKTIPSGKGESPVLDENLVPEEQINMLWKGSFITAGSGKAIVTALGEDCYIEKTGGREKSAQRSYTYNKKYNIGKLFAAVFAIIVTVLMLIVAIASGKWIETLVCYAAVLGLIAIEPVSGLAEWMYYHTAKKLSNKGVLIRNINSFDLLNKEQRLCFTSEELIEDQIAFSECIPIVSSEKAALSLFAMTLNSKKWFNVLKRPLEEYRITVEKIHRKFPSFRRERDQVGNSFCLLSDEGKSMLAVSGYWKNVLPLLKSPDAELLNRIVELERHGKAVWLLAADQMNFIPNHLDSESFGGKLKIEALFVFDIALDEKTHRMILRMRRTGLEVCLSNMHSASVADYLAAAYDMSEVVAAEEVALFSEGLQESVAYSDSSPIKKEVASLVLERGVSAQSLIYQIKCMFCGIDRSLNYLMTFGGLWLIGTFILMLQKVDSAAVLFPIILLQPILIVLSYALIGTVRNCNQSKKSHIYGAIAGGTYIVAAIFLPEVAAVIALLSVVLYAISITIKKAIHYNVSFAEWGMLYVALVIAVLPLVIFGGSWLAVLLVSIFPALAAFIIEIFY
jgi:hypothetical protein